MLSNCCIILIYVFIYMYTYMISRKTIKKPKYGNMIRIGARALARVMICGLHARRGMELPFGNPGRGTTRDLQSLHNTPHRLRLSAFLSVALTLRNAEAKTTSWTKSVGMYRKTCQMHSRRRPRGSLDASERRTCDECGIFVTEGFVRVGWLQLERCDKVP